VKVYNPANRAKRKGTGRFRKYTYEEIIARDKTSLDIFWLKDDSLEDSANLPEPDVLASEITENLAAALALFKSIGENLKS
jgi:type I restriction enzyme M protein